LPFAELAYVFEQPFSFVRREFVWMTVRLRVRPAVVTGQVACLRQFPDEHNGTA
jgi:hypothetical protein